MNDQVIKEWPKPDLETLDRELGDRLHRLATGAASARDVSEASKLIRERADFMMPGLFQKLGVRPVKKKAC